MMDATATSSNANLVAGGSTYLHGVALADFAVTCGNLTGVTLWAPVQGECSIGTLANDIDQTMFLDEVYINSFELSYSTGANATENYGAETDNKMWLLNDGKFVNYQEITVTGGAVSGTLNLADDEEVAVLTAGIGFLRKDANGAPAVTWWDSSENEMENVEIAVGTAPVDNTYIYHNTGSGHIIYFPTVTKVPADGDKIQLVYSASAYAAMNEYFIPLEEPTERPDSVGALRQGQVEVYIVDPDDTSAVDYTNAWRLTSASISADLTREPLAELGHLGPYDRPLTLPIPITMSVDSTAGDLENWAKFAGLLKDYLDETVDDIDLADLMNKSNLILVVKVFQQTDEEAGGTHDNRKVLTGSELDGEEYFLDGAMSTYSGGDTERALKTVVVKNLKITDEGMTLDVGSNATQTFGFRSTNDLFVIKGDVSYDTVKSSIVRNV
jgi:hypothetical protein